MNNFFTPRAYGGQIPGLDHILRAPYGSSDQVRESTASVYGSAGATFDHLDQVRLGFWSESAPPQDHDLNFIFSVLPDHLGEGFGINTNLYETNVLNLAVVVFVVINFGGSVITDILSLRRTEILNALSTAEAKAQEAKEQIQKEEVELKAIEEKAQILLDNAKKNAERGRSLLLEQHKKDLSDTYDAFSLRKFVEQREVTDGLRAMAQNFACLRATARLEKSMAQKDHLLIMDKGLELFSKNL